MPAPILVGLSFPRDSMDRSESVDPLKGIGAAPLTGVLLPPMGDGVGFPSASLLASAVNFEILSLRLSLAGS